MYTMKQIVDSKSMIYDLPTSMYRMKNIYGTGTDANVPPSTTNGVVSHHHSSYNQLPDISQQIENILKVFTTLKLK